MRSLLRERAPHSPRRGRGEGQHGQGRGRNEEHFAKGRSVGHIEAYLERWAYGHKGPWNIVPLYRKAKRATAVSAQIAITANVLPCAIIPSIRSEKSPNPMIPQFRFGAGITSWSVLSSGLGSGMASLSSECKVSCYLNLPHPVPSSESEIVPGVR